MLCRRCTTHNDRSAERGAGNGLVRFLTLYIYLNVQFISSLHPGVAGRVKDTPVWRQGCPFKAATLPR